MHRINQAIGLALMSLILSASARDPCNTASTWVEATEVIGTYKTTVTQAKYLDEGKMKWKNDCDNVNYYETNGCRTVACTPTYTGRKIYESTSKEEKGPGRWNVDTKEYQPALHSPNPWSDDTDPNYFVTYQEYMVCQDSVDDTGWKDCQIWWTKEIYKKVYQDYCSVITKSWDVQPLTFNGQKFEKAKDGQSDSECFNGYCILYPHVDKGVPPSDLRKTFSGEVTLYSDGRTYSYTASFSNGNVQDYLGLLTNTMWIGLAEDYTDKNGVVHYSAVDYADQPQSSSH